MNRLIKACEVMDLNFIKIQYNAFDDGLQSTHLLQEKRSTSMSKFSIEGMTCVACVDAVQNAVRALPGVTTIRVSLALCQASVIHDPVLVSESELAAAITSSGYTAKSGQRSAQESLEATEQNEQVKNLQKSFGEALTMITMISTLNGMSGFFYNNKTLMVMAVVAIAVWVQFSAARNIHRAAWLGRKLDMDFLTSISLLLSSLLGLFNLYMLEMPRAVTYLSSASYLATVILGGRYLRAILQRQTTKSLAQLYRLQCQTAQVEVFRVRQNSDINSIDLVPALALEAGDQIWLPSGRLIPCDCYIVSGRSIIDQSSMTGESLPVVRTTGDFLMSGTENLSAPLLAVVSQTQEQSALDKLVASIADATETQPEDDSSSIPTGHFVKIVLFISLASVIYELSYSTSNRSMNQRANIACGRAVAILASACPCALGLATPSAYLSALTVAWDKGIILSGGVSTLRELRSLTHLIADKTGTLTTGQLKVTHVDGKLNLWHHQAICASERVDSQTHPVGRAVFQWALSQLSETQRLEQSKINISDLDSVPGSGVHSIIQHPNTHESHHVHIGTARFLRQSGIILKNYISQHNDNQSVVHVAMDNHHIATLFVQDTVRPEAASVLASMKKNSNIDVTMLTGDNSTEATRISSMLNIPVLSAQALPHQKQEMVARTQSLAPTNCVAMLGDGLNDIAAMAAADVGILLSPGLSKSNTACVQAADVILTSPHLGAILEVLEIARQTMQQIRFNNVWAITYNMLAVSVACGVFESFGLRLDAAMAGSVMAFSSISVIAFSLLLRRRLTSIDYKK